MDVVPLAAALVSGAATALLAARLQTLRPARPDAIAPVSVVIPARNEAGSLPRLLSSLGRLDPAPLEVIVVDDDSDDATATLAAEAGAWVVSTSPAAGWLGKPWACQTGADQASGTLVLFLDADTDLAPGALGALLALHGERGGLVSVQPHHRTESRVEELSAYPNAVSALGSGAFAIGPGRRDRAGVAFGPCLLTTVADYRLVGGHRTVRGEVIEDIRLAQRYRDAGLPVTCRVGGDLIGFRMYPGGLRPLIDGWSKNLAAGATAARPLTSIATVLWVVSQALVAGALITGLAGWAIGSGSMPVEAAVAWVAVAARLAWLLHRLGSFRWTTAALFPLPLVAFIALFARSAWLTGTRRPVRWRGRRIPVRPGG